MGRPSVPACRMPLAALAHAEHAPSANSLQNSIIWPRLNRRRTPRLSVEWARPLRHMTSAPRAARGSAPAPAAEMAAPCGRFLAPCRRRFFPPAMPDGRDRGLGRHALFCIRHGVVVRPGSAPWRRAGGRMVGRGEEEEEAERKEQGVCARPRPPLPPAGPSRRRFLGQGDCARRRRPPPPRSPKNRPADQHF